MKIESLKTPIVDNKKYLLVYIVFLAIFVFSMLGPKNYQYWGFEIISIPIVGLVGLIVILYSFKNEIEIHKVALILIILFGIMMVFLAPPMSYSDESAHFTRAELLSEGVLNPIKTDEGYYVNNYHFGLNTAQQGLTIFDNDHVDDPITDSKGYWSWTTESPFYSYIPSAIGILLAKCLHLTAMWALWFARIANLLVYGAVAYFSIKKAPTFKLGLTVLATFPLAIAQASSTSYDAFILTFTLIILYYFIKMFKEKVENKDLAIFFISILLISLIKPPYLMLSFLILTIPKENFSKNRYYTYIGIVLTIIITLISFGGILNLIFGISAASTNVTSNISISGQINAILANPHILIDLIKFTITDIGKLFVSNSSFYHYADFKGLKLFNLVYMVFFIAFCLFYKQDIDLSKKNRSILSIIFIITYFGIYGILYLIWTPVGSNIILGVQSRYFIPILALLPLIINIKTKSWEDYKYLITFITLFLIGLILLTITHYY